MGFREVQAMADSEARVVVDGRYGTVVGYGQRRINEGDKYVTTLPRVKFDLGGEYLVDGWRRADEVPVFHEIVFLQGDEYSEVADMGPDELFDHLVQWDMGEDSEHTPREKVPWGTYDTTYERGDYVVSVNHAFGYVGLTRVEYV